MAHVTCRLTAKNRDELRNPTLANRVWATFTFLLYSCTDEGEIWQVKFHLHRCSMSHGTLWDENNEQIDL